MPSVLVVDDESQIRDLLSRWIGGDGHEVRQAATAAAALDDMQSAPSDIVMCDVHMPGPTGIWLADRIRDSYPTTAIVFATADATLQPAQTFRKGIVGYVWKPFRHDLLLQP